jgi:biotin carboxyl carrier protein
MWGVTVLAVVSADTQVQEVLRKLYWGSAWLSNVFQKNLLDQQKAGLERAALTMDLSVELLDKDQVGEAALAFVNLASLRLKLRRVSLGLARGGRIRLTAVSNTAKVQRQNESMQLIEEAMEEAMDQRRYILFPPMENASAAREFVITDAHARLSEKGGGGAVMSFSLLDHGQPMGVLSFEFPARHLITREDRLAGEALAHLLGPALKSKLQLDHWLTGRWKYHLDALLEKVFGPERPTYKLGAILLGFLLVFLAVGVGEFRVTAKTLVEGMVQRSAVAPFEGFIAEGPVRAGDEVEAGQVLATLDDKDLRLEKVRWQSDREQTARKYQDALAKHDRASARILGAQLQEAEAQLALVEEKLARAKIRAPFRGVVVSGDLRQMLGAPVEQGKELFQIAPLDSYRVILKVDERDILYVNEGQKGLLTLSGLAGESQPFTVEKVTSVATAEEGINYFRVEAQLEKAISLRPGMEGVGKIEAGERRLWWIWTHRFFDWLRISLWRWLP